MKKYLAIGIILLLVGAGIIPAIAQDIEKSSTSQGNWLYVGGSGPGNYSKIQDAINDASDGDTVFVFNGIYSHNEITVDKSILLIGEDKNNTIITDGYFATPLVSITADGVIMKGFKLLNNDQYFGIILCSDNNLIMNNIIADCRIGIEIINVDVGNNTISENIIESNSEFGISIVNDCKDIAIKDNIIRFNGGYGILGSTYNTMICGNYFENNSIGIAPNGPLKTPICDNIFVNNGYGIHIGGLIGFNMTRNSFQNNNYGVFVICGGQGNNIKSNNFRNNTYGVYLEYGRNTIAYNNFIGNINDATFKYYFNYGGLQKNYWHRNYWNQPRFLPKCINGQLVFVNQEQQENAYSWLNLDWHPAQEPYDITGMT
jgi:parallel beta-helix repeat protein